MIQQIDIIKELITILYTQNDITKQDNVKEKALGVINEQKFIES